MTRNNEQRQFERFRGRVRCVVHNGENEYRGFVTNLSARGLFLQSRHTLTAGTKVVLTLEPEGSCAVTLTGAVARERRSHRAARAVESSGCGIELESAPEEYFRLIMDMTSGS